MENCASMYLHNRLLKPIIAVQHDCGARGMGEGYGMTFLILARY